MSVAAERLRADRVLDGLRPHPRLIVDRERLAAIRALTAGDAFAAAVLRSCRERMQELHRAQRQGRSHRELKVDESLTLLLDGSLVWRLTGDAEVLACVRRHLADLCADPPLPRDNFLAIGEHAYGLAIAYDWLRDELPADERERLRQHLVEAILRQGLAAYDDGDWWIDSAVNWNHECNGGLITAALAVADTDPEVARAILPRALRWFDLALEGYDPDGAWDEGAGYWNRATMFAVYALAALESALGDDGGLSDRPGLARTGDFALATVGPSGQVARYADCTAGRRLRSLAPQLQWLGRRYRRPELAADEVAYAARTDRSSAHLWWYEPPPVRVPALPRDSLFRGPGPLAVLRGAWDDPRAAFAWLKGGSNQVNHGHLDQGNFEFDALGQRWARDLGSDDYALPGYFDRQPGGRRWEWYRLGSRSHSVPLLDGANQQPAAIVRLTGFEPDPQDPRVVADLSEAYKPAAGLARRGLLLLHRRALLVQDEFSLTKPCRFTWAMTTDAEITIAGATAHLSLGGERLTASILAPAGAVFSQESAERPPPEAPNTGVRRLLVDLPRSEGRLRVAVLLAPHWPDGGPLSPPAITPLGRWF